ncbi:MAG: adenylate/guanylate cyclase domain-containing protein [Pseudomonadota bacterium]
MERRLTAILAADVVGYSRLMERDEAGTLNRLMSLRRELVEPSLAEFNGRVVKLMGDGLLAEFSSVVEAVQCAIQLQQSMADREPGVSSDQRVQLRIGVNLGDIIVEDSDIYGDGVNIAARLEGLAEPGGICITSVVRESLGNRINEDFEDTGLHEVKNIARPIHVYRWSSQKPAMANASGGEAALALPDKPSIVVLPFDNMSGDPSQEYFADGIVEAITAALANIRSFFVIARNTAFTYKGKHIDVRAVGQEIGVGYALEGSVQRAGNRIRITAQLIETQNGAHVWAQKFDGSVDEIFELQDQITEQVAGSLQPSIHQAEIEKVRRKRPQDMGAYDLTMRALPHVWVLEKEESGKALDFLSKALEIDPDYPLALSLAAWSHAQRAVYNWAEDTEASKREAIRLAEKAANLSGDDPLVLSVLGTAHTVVRNHGTARILLERAVSIDPNAAWALSRLGWLETYAERLEPALEYFGRARRLSPLDPLTFNTFVGMASAYQGAGQYEKSIEYFHRALQERPQAFWIYRSLAPALVSAGRMDEARASFNILMQHYPDLTQKRFKEAMAFTDEFMAELLRGLEILGMPAE